MSNEEAFSGIDESIEDPSSLIELVRKRPHYIRDVSEFEFKKTIGEGGFGEVWLATHISSRETCAIKEIFNQRMEKHHLLRFVREVDTMATVQNPFVLKMIGYSLESPFSIMTEFMPNGSLRKHSYSFDPHRIQSTHATIVAMCIAHGMRAIHANHIVHRDLKSANILLDSKLLPKICDFGLARIYPEDDEEKKKYLSKRCGTLQYMAPELMLSRNYDYKADVFSYALILYELSEGKTIYRGVRKEDLVKYSMNGIRPTFTKETPPELQKFIERCWSQDPVDRPTFNEIFQEFAAGNVLFRKANKTKVLQFAKTINTDYRIEKPKITADIKGILRRLTAAENGNEVEGEDYVSEHEANEERIEVENSVDLQDEESESNQVAAETDPTKIIMMPRHQYFTFVYREKVSTVNLEQFPEFWRLTSGFLSDNKVPTNAYEYIVTACISVMKGDPNLIQLFAASNFFNLISMKSEKIIDLSFFAIILFIEQAPHFTLKRNIERLLQRLIFIHAYDSVFLFSKLIRQFPKMPDPYSIADIFISYFKVFSNPVCSPMYIRCIYHIMKHYTIFVQTRKETLISLLIELCHHSFESTKNALIAYTNLYQPDFKVPFDVIIKALDNEILAQIAISLLMRIPSIPVSNEMHKALITRSFVDEKASLVLCKYAVQDINSLNLFTTNSEWLDQTLPNTLGTFRLFLAIFTFPQTREKLFESPHFPGFLLMIGRSSNSFVLCSMPSIIKRLKLSVERIAYLDTQHVFDVYFNTCAQSQELNVAQSAIILIDNLSRIGFSTGIIHYLPRMVQLLGQAQLSSIVISTFVTVSYHPQAVPTLLQLGLADYFNRLMGVAGYEEYARLFVANVSK